VPKLDLVGTSEIRERHGLARHRVFRLRRRGLWPEPLAQLHCGAIWDGREVKEAVRKLQRRGQL
jgi:hypothetical protein